MVSHTHAVNALRRLCCLALAALMLAGGAPVAWAEAMGGETGPAAAPEPARDFQNSLSRMVGEIGAVTLYHAAYNAETDPVQAYLDAHAYAGDHGLSEDFARLGGAIVGAQKLEYDNTALYQYLTSRRVDLDSVATPSDLFEKANSIPVRDEALSFLASQGPPFEFPCAVWMNAPLKQFYGAERAVFTPKAPRANTCLAVLADDSEYRYNLGSRAADDPNTAFEEEKGHITDALSQIGSAFPEGGFEFTGNPDLASVVLELKVKYELAGLYGISLSAYNCHWTVTAYDAVKHRKIASFEADGTFGSSIRAAAGTLTAFHGWPGADEAKLAKFVKSLTAFGESFRVSAPKAAAKATATAEPPAPLETPAAEAAEQPAGGAPDNGAVRALIARLAESEEDPWQKAIYAAECQTVEWDGGVCAVRLRSFNPRLDESLDGDALSRILESASAYDLRVEVECEGAEPTDAGEAALKRAVKNAAAQSKAAFDDKRARIAIAERLFPAHIKSARKAQDLLNTSEDFGSWLASHQAGALEGLESPEAAPLFYAQAGQSLRVDGGPGALVLRCSGANPEKLLESAAAGALKALAGMPSDERTRDETIREALLGALAERALELRRAPDESFDLTLDVDGLAAGDFGGDYADYLARYAFQETLDSLAEQVYALSDLPARDFPKSGWLGGSTKGTKVIVKAPDDGVGRYIQFRSNSSDEMAISGFIRPGGSCTVRVPKGNYYMLIASGTVWYGEDGLFAGDGAYSRTEEFEVKGINYYHTITLGGVADGNMSSYDADPDAFRQN